MRRLGFDELSWAATCTTNPQSRALWQRAGTVSVIYMTDIG
jgi:hypothetical protein